MTVSAEAGRRPDDVPTRTFEWGTIKWLVTPNLVDADAGLTVGEVIVYPGQGHAPHDHPGEEEVIYVVSGEGEQTVGDGPAFPIREGDAVYIPRGTTHSTYNTTWRPLRLTVVYTPGGAETGLDGLPDARILEPGVAPRWTQGD